VIVLALLALAAPAQRGADLVVHADRLYAAPGTVIEDGVVALAGEKIATIARGAPDSGGSDVIHVAAITAGMIDASGRVTPGQLAVEQSREVTPNVAVAVGLDVYDVGWARHLESGVTTVFVAPDSYNVIGGFGIVLKTGGPESIEARTLRADAAVCGAIGGRPSSGNSPASGTPRMKSRRPTTRMGVEWEWRKAFYDAEASERVPERAFPGSDVLRAVLRGEHALVVEAWTTQDIRTAVFLKEEMEREGLGDLRLVIDAGAEAWKEPQLLVRTGTPVVLPPFGDGRVGPERAFHAWNTAKLLRDAGLDVALSSHGAESPATTLGMQAGYAMRGGLSFDEALAAVTTTPARLLGVADRVGTVEAGKDADLVLWSGTPFEPSSRVLGVVLDGELVVDELPD